MSGAVAQAPGGCGCPGCITSVRGVIGLCFGFTESGTVVEAHDSTAGGTLLAAATTGVDGSYGLLNFAVTPARVVVIVAKRPGFDDATRSLAYSTSIFDDLHWLCGGTTTILAGAIQPVPDATHHCWVDCADPLPDTVTMGDSVLGGRSLTWDGTNWTNITHGFPGCGLCAGLTPDTVTMRWRLSRNGFLDIAYTCDFDFPLFFTTIFTGRVLTVDCPPSFLATIRGPGGGAYCGVLPTLTFTA